jgi:hypothetical protein
MKKVFSVVLLVALTGVFAWAQTSSSDIPTVPNPSGVDTALPHGPLGLDEGAASIIDAATYGRYGSWYGDAVGVTDWQGLMDGFNKYFFYVGGANGDGIRNGTGNYTNLGGAGFDGGLGVKIGANYLGVHLNGNFFTGGGKDDGYDQKETNKVTSKATWNNALSILFGNEGIGGIRLNVIFDEAAFENGTFKDKKESRYYFSGKVLTGLQWGKDLGAVTLKAGAGFQWPEYTSLKDEDKQTGDHPDKGEMFSNGALGVNVAVDVNNPIGPGFLGGEYQLTLNFGGTAKKAAPNSLTSLTDPRGWAIDSAQIIDIKDTEWWGYVDNALTLGYKIVVPVFEKMEMVFRPRLDMELLFVDNYFKYDGTKYYSSAPSTYFYLDPRIQVGAKYQLKEKVTVFTGMELGVLGWTIRNDWKYDPDSSVDGDVKDSPTWWTVRGFDFKGGSIAVAIEPSKALTIEFGITNLLNYQEGKWDIGANWSNLKGGLAVTVRPGAGGGAAPAKAAAPAAAPAPAPAPAPVVEPIEE